jgi:hypothetical protein
MCAYPGCLAGCPSRARIGICSPADTDPDTRLRPTPPARGTFSGIIACAAAPATSARTPGSRTVAPGRCRASTASPGK